MKTLCLSTVLLLSLFSFSADIEMKLECHDVMQGEIQMGARDLFSFTIQNNTSKPVRLLTNASHWARSPNWKAHVEGPIDERCLTIGVVVTDLPAVGIPSSIEVPANGTVNRINTGGGAVNPGTYTLWVEYFGENAPEGYYQGYIKSNKCTYTIQPPQGEDAEIFGLWQKQNLDRPVCEFPLDMEPDILKPEILLEKYPASTYAAWSLLKYLSAPEKWPAVQLLDLIERGLYPHSNSVPYPGAKGGRKSLSEDDMAKWQKEWAEKILAQHPRIIIAPRLKLVSAVMQFVLGEREKSIESLKAISKAGQDKQSIWAKEFVSLIEKEHKPQTPIIP